MTAIANQFGVWRTGNLANGFESNGRTSSNSLQANSDSRTIFGDYYRPLEFQYTGGDTKWNIGTALWSGWNGPVTTAQAFNTTLVADAGSYALELASNITRSDGLSVDRGSYALAGFAAAFRRAFTLSVDSGVYALAGAEAPLTYAPAGGALTTVYNVPLTTDESGWAQQTHVVLLGAGNLGTATGTQVRVSLQFGDVVSAGKTLTAYIGQRAASGDLYDFANTPSRLTFGGANDITTDGTTTGWTSDFVALPEAYDEAKDYLVAIQASVVSAMKIKLAASVGDKLYYHSGLDAATVNKSAYSLWHDDSAAIVTKVEIQGAAGPAAYNLSAAVGAYSLTGVAVSLRAARNTIAVSGAYALTGRAAGLPLTLPAASGAYALTGRVAGLSLSLPAANGTYALTGRAVGLSLKRAAASGTYALTGRDVGLSRTGSYSLAAAQGTYALTGRAAGLNYSGFNKAITAAAGTYTWSIASNITFGYGLNAASGSYALTGRAATLTSSHVGSYTLSAVSGAYAVTGRAATLTYAPAGALTTVYNVSLTADDAGWGAQTHVVLLGAGNLGAASGTTARVTLQFGALAAGKTLVAYIGQRAASGDLYDFANTPSHLTFGGTDITTDGTTLVWLSDFVPLPEAYNEAKDYLVAVQSLGTGTLTLKKAASTGDQLYYKGAQDAATVNKTAYNLWLDGSAAIVTKVEIQGAAGPAAYTLPAVAGSYSVTGRAATLTTSHASTYTLPAVAGTYVWSIASNITFAYGLNAASGSYALTGRAATLSTSHFSGAYTLPAVRGVYIVNGADSVNDIALRVSSGSYALTGRAAALSTTHGASYTLPAVKGTYALTGRAVTLVRNRTVVAVKGTYTLTGRVAGLAAGRRLTAASGTYSLTGRAASLSTSHSGAKTLTVDAGSYALTGRTAVLKFGHRLSAAAGAYSLTGRAATVSRTRAIVAAKGTYTLTGRTVALTTAGNFAVASNTGSYGVTGNAAVLRVGRKLAAARGTYALTGRATTLVRARYIVAASGPYAVTGVTAGLRFGHRLPAAKGSFSLTGNAALFPRARAVIAARGVYGVTGRAVTLKLNHGIAAARGTYTLTGRSILFSQTAPFPRSATVGRVRSPDQLSEGTRNGTQASDAPVRRANNG
jgi:hypothetical protein